MHAKPQGALTGQGCQKRATAAADLEHHLWEQQGINEQSLSEEAGQKEEAAAISPQGSLAPSSGACVPEQKLYSKQASL